MDTTTTEIADDIFRISTFVPEAGMSFNQFLVKADEPLLFHTGMRALFPCVSDAVSRVIPLPSLRWIGFGHVEADECGAMNDWLRAADDAQVACSGLGCMVSINDLADRAPHPLDDGDIIDLGGKRVRYFATPHVPHGWGRWPAVRGDHIDAAMRRPLHPARRGPSHPKRLADGTGHSGRGHAGLLDPGSLNRAHRGAARRPRPKNTRAHARTHLHGQWATVAPRPRCQLPTPNRHCANSSLQTTGHIANRSASGLAVSRSWTSMDRAMPSIRRIAQKCQADEALQTARNLHIRVGGDPHIVHCGEGCRWPPSWALHDPCLQRARISAQQPDTAIRRGGPAIDFGDADAEGRSPRVTHPLLTTAAGVPPVGSGKVLTGDRLRVGEAVRDDGPTAKPEAPPTTTGTERCAVRYSCIDSTRTIRTISLVGSGLIAGYWVVPSLMVPPGWTKALPGLE